jgi:hypothetical protein
MGSRSLEVHCGRRISLSCVALLGLVVAALALAVTTLAVAVTTSGASELEGEWSWRWIGSPASRGAAPHILARGSREDRVAAGDLGGVSLLREGRYDRAALEGVLDLAFDRNGTLWIATGAGLYQWGSSERPTRRALSGGQRANFIHRLVANQAGMLVATQAGAFWSTQGRVFQPLMVGGASAPATLVAMERGVLAPRVHETNASAAPLRRLWILRADQLFEVVGFVVESGLRVIETRMLSLPRPMDARRPVDLVVDPQDTRLHLVFGDVIASRSITASASERDTVSWRIDRPVLPPGSHIRRLAWGPDGRHWIATDRGLLEADGLSQAFRRSNGPRGNECVDVRSGEESPLVSLCRRGIYSWTQRSSEVARVLADGVLGDVTQDITQDANHDRTHEVAEENSAPASDSERVGEVGVEIDLDGDPPLSQIRARALRRAGLGVERSQRLREGLHERAFWPELSLRIGADLDRDRENDDRQSFVSGDTRFLHDTKRDRNFGFGASIQFDWELGGIAYPDAAVDLSRELRQVISLRDDVSDEINQLYFERQGIRERLLGREALAPEEVLRLRLRAGEIEAGLDAWTGGWLSRWRLDRRMNPSSREEDPNQHAVHSRDVRLGPDDPVERKYE